jgi:hypothetical protein
MPSLPAKPSSDGFPEGLLDQPFYGWVQLANSNDSPFQRAYPFGDAQFNKAVKTA